MVSIIIPTYNRATYISETLNSVVNQSWENWECIVVDDGSNDEIEYVIQQYIKIDKRFSFYERPHEMLKGANSCRNFGFEKAGGKYIKFLDSDDLLTPDALYKQVKVLEKENVFKVCFSYGRYFIDESKELAEFWSRNKESTDYLLDHITNKIRWAISDPLWRKCFFSEPPFRDGLMNSQEWLMHGISIINLKKEEIFNLKECFSLIRRGNERMSSEKSSYYYKNQKLARIYLLQSLIFKKVKNIDPYYQLSKQILVYYFWQIRKKYL